MNSMGKLMNMNIFIKYITLYLETITAIYFRSQSSVASGPVSIANFPPK